MSTNWSITVDWDRNGWNSDEAPNDDYEDVTNRVISANWFLGMRQPYQDMADNSMLQLVLDNSDKQFSPESTMLTDDKPNPLFGKLASFRTARAI